MEEEKRQQGAPLETRRQYARLRRKIKDEGGKNILKDMGEKGSQVSR